MDNKDSHILVLNRSFWPDIEATGQSLTELSEELAKIYRVTAIVGRSYYVEKDAFKPLQFYRRELFNNIEILRVRHTRFWKEIFVGRLINWLTYCVLTFIIALRMKPKITIACTDPPFLGIIAMVIKYLKSITYIYNCRDLYPDSALEIKRLEPGPVSYIFDYFNNKSLKASCFVVALGLSMKDRMVKTKGIPPEHIKVIPDWVDASKISPVLKNNNPLRERFGLKDKFVIMYSGNIGLSQDFSSILKSIATIKERTFFSLIFIGEGAGKENLKKEVKQLGLENVLFLSYQPQDTLSFSLGMADLHIIPLKKGMAGASVPSKMYGILAAGRPYLAITDKESEPARLVEEFGCGLWVSPDDIKVIAKTIGWAINHPDELEKMGRIGRQIAVTKFDKEVVTKEWFGLLESLIDEQ